MSTRIEDWEEVEVGTAGISSALQMVSSTSATQIQLGAMIPANTQPSSPHNTDETPKNDPTFREVIRGVIRRHRKTLDALA